jgi:hypothetical protein
MQMMALCGIILLGSLAAKAETVQGTFRYARQNGAQRPIAHANVEIWRFAPRAFGIWGWGHDGDAVTDANGHISREMQFVQNGVIYAVRVFATNYAAVVWPKDAISAVSFFKEPTGADGNPINLTVNFPSDVLDFTFDFGDAESPLHYNLAEAVRHGFDYAVTHRDPTETESIGQVHIQPHSSGTSFYKPINNTININSAMAFQDIGALHEYGHFLENKLSNFFAMPSEHDGCTATIGGVVVNSGEHAWMEGFADYFAQVVARSLPSGTVTGSGGTMSVSTLETPPACSAATPDKVELFVAASLWDLFDAPGDSGAVSEAWDFMGRMDGCVFQIFDKELAHLNRAPNIFDFYNAWIGRGCPDRIGVNRILSHFGILPPLPLQTAECLGMNAPSTMMPGQPYNVSVVMRNTGETTWTPAANHKLGTQSPQDNWNFGLNRVPLTLSVPPGGQVGFNFTVNGPSVPGVYALQFRMAQEWVEWFGDFTPSITVTVPARNLRLEVIPVSNTTSTETVRVNAYDSITNAPVPGTVTSPITLPASTGSNITFTRQYVWDCTDVAGGRPRCHREPVQVVFTVNAPGYNPASYWY